MKSKETNHGILSKEFAQEMDRFTNSTISEGNCVTLLPSGSKSYEQRWRVLSSATKHIHIVTFSMMRDKTSKKLVKLVQDKAKESVNTCMIIDDAAHWTTLCGPLLTSMTRAGAETIRYHKIFRDVFPKFNEPHPFKQWAAIFKLKLKRHFHEKYLVVDGHTSILGGNNWGDKYAYGGIKKKAWRDTDVLITGPVVANIQDRFVHDQFLFRAMEDEYSAKKKRDFNSAAHYESYKRQEQTYRTEMHDHLFPKLTPTGNDRVRYICHKPYDEHRLPITNACLMLFKQAKKYIYWGCHGIRPPRVIADGLIEAAKRGVDVRLITNSKKSARTLMLMGLMGWMYWECTQHYRHLIENGIKVYEWQKPGAFHSKNLVIDDVIASVGSYNIARGSTFHHSESNVYVYGGDLPSQVHELFLTDLKDCVEITLDRAKIPKPKHDPFKRLLHEHNLLIEPTLISEAVKRDLEAGNIKYIYKPD